MRAEGGANGSEKTQVLSSNRMSAQTHWDIQSPVAHGCLQSRTQEVRNLEDL